MCGHHSYRLALIAAIVAGVLAQGGATAGERGVDLSWRPPPPEHDKELIERVYVEDRTPPKASAQEEEQGFILYQRPFTELVFGDSIPGKGERLERLSALAAPGQYESVTVAVYALRDLGGVRMTVGDLSLADGAAKLSQSNVDVRVARSVFKRITHYGGPGEFMYMPTWLSREEKIDIGAGRSAWFWVTVRVPADATPGLYKGTLSIGAGKAAEVPIEIEILPITLPDQPDVNVGFYDSPTAEKLAQQRAAGMTSVGWHGASGAKLTLAEDKVTVGLTGSAMEKVMQAYGAAGFRRPILWLMTGDVCAWCLKQADVDSERFAGLYRSAMHQIHDEAVRRGWAEVITQPEDECPSHPDRMARAKRKLPLLKAAGFRTEMDHYLAYSDKGGSNDQWVKATLPFVDVITLRYWYDARLGQAPWAQVVKRVSQLKKELWTYNITAAHMFPQPTSMRFNGGWFFRTLGKTCKGMYFWAYSSIHGDPYNDLDAEYSDWLYYYPPDPKRGYSGGPSIDLVCLREGLDDLRYIEALERLIEASGNAREAKTARARLAGLVRSFDFSGAKKRSVEGTQSVWQTLEERGGVRIARGWYRYPNGWTAGEYDKARRALAREILKLQGKALQGGSQSGGR